MNLIKFFIPTIWVIICLYTVSFLLDMMNQANTIANILGFLGILLVLYLSIVTKLGMFIFSINFKNKSN